MSYANQLSSVQVPDVVPTNLPTYGLFSMAAGDFLEVYTEKGPIVTEQVMSCSYKYYVV